MYFIKQQSPLPTSLTVPLISTATTPINVNNQADIVIQTGTGELQGSPPFVEDWRTPFKSQIYQHLHRRGRFQNSPDRIL